MKKFDRKKDGISQKDWKFMEQMPYGDPDFDPEHNRRVIAEVDAWNDQMDRQRVREYKERTKERTNAVAQYLKNLTQGRGITKIDQYFGKRELARLRGEEIVSQLKANPALVEKMKQRWAGKGKLTSL